MAQENKISVVFAAADEAALKKAVADVGKVTVGKAISLKAKDRKTFGRVKYEKVVWIDKVKELMDANAGTIPRFIDKAEFDRDYAAFKVLMPVITAMEQQLDLLKDTALLLGYDLDVSALMYYRTMRSEAENNAPGSRSIYDELKVQYPGPKTKKAGPAEPAKAEEGSKPE